MNRYLPPGPQLPTFGGPPTGPSIVAILLTFALLSLGGLWIVRAWNGHDTTAKPTLPVRFANLNDLDDIQIHLTHANQRLKEASAETKRTQDRLKQLSNVLNITGTDLQRARLRDADNSSQATMRMLADAVEEIDTAHERITIIK